MPITGRHGRMVTARFDHVQYIPVLSRDFGSVETAPMDIVYCDSLHCQWTIL